MEFDRAFQINLSDIKWDADSFPELRGLLEDYLRMQQTYNAGIKEVRTKLEILDDEFRALYDHNPIHHIAYRLKSPRSILDKLDRKRLPVTIASIRENVMDIAGVRVVCNYIDDIYRIADLFTRQDDIKLIRRRDYIQDPKENGYRSLHLVVKVPVFLAETTESVPVEVQIRTIAMDFWASLEHQLHYKATGDVSEELGNRLAQCARESAALDAEMQAIYKALKER